MVKILRFFCGVVCAAFVMPAFANVAKTVGNNLTAYSGTGAISNNQWNTMMNARTNAPATSATANYGNCNAVILRCASPKCASGGCADMGIARPIVAGCVNSNNACKKYGDELIDYITAQVVAQSTAKLREQEQAIAIAQANAEAQAAAASAAAEQGNAQMQQMQMQMRQMQSQMAESMNAMREQMAAQNESQVAQIQTALAAQNSYSAPDSSGADMAANAAALEGLSVAEQLAIKNNVNPDLLVREQMGGQIQTAIDDAMTAMTDLKGKLDAVLEYAGCDAGANSCTGPRRVKKFKELANAFFDPYENVLDSTYDALILAMSVGVDVKDVLMLLGDSCNAWGKYMCDACSPSEEGADGCHCDADKKNCYYRPVKNAEGKVVAGAGRCRLIGLIKDQEEVRREWVEANTGVSGAIYVDCASDVIAGSKWFSGKRAKTTLSADALRSLVNQDSYSVCRNKASSNNAVNAITDCGADVCAINKNDTNGLVLFEMLQDAANTKKLGDKKKYCFETREKMKSFAVETGQEASEPNCEAQLGEYECYQEGPNGACLWNSCKCYSAGGGMNSSSLSITSLQTPVAANCGVFQTMRNCIAAGCEWNDGTCSFSAPKIDFTPKELNTFVTPGSGGLFHKS